MASREMYDVLQRLRELDAENPNVHSDALDNTVKMNGSVTEAEFKKGDKVKVDGKETTITVPNGPGDLVGVDKDGKTDMVKASKVEKLDEAIQIVVDSPEDMEDLAKIMALAGLKPVTPDMMPSTDNTPVMKADQPVSGDCGCGELNAIRKNAGLPEADVQEGKMSDMAIEIEEWAKKYENHIGNNGDTLPEGYVKYLMDSGIFSDAYDQDETAKAEKMIGKPYTEWDYNDQERALEVMPITKAMFDDIEKITGTSGEDAAEMVADVLDNMEEGYDNEPNTDYRRYDPEYADKTDHASRKVKYTPANSGDNPLEGLEAHLMQAYEEFMAERELSKAEEKEKERIFKGMKKSKSDFKDRYGDRGEEVMHATATKMAKKSK